MVGFVVVSIVRRIIDLLPAQICAGVCSSIVVPSDISKASSRPGANDSFRSTPHQIRIESSPCQHETTKEPCDILAPNLGVVKGHRVLLW